MSSYGFPDGQEITEWLGQPIDEQTAWPIGAGSKVVGPAVLANFASIIIAVKPTGGQVSVTIKQAIAGGPAALTLSQTVIVPAGTTLFEAFVLFADQVTVTLQGAVGGTTVDYAVYPSNTTTNAQVIQSASISIQKNEVPVAAEPTLDFVDGSGNLWSVIDDAANTRIKIALLAGLPSVQVTNSVAQPQVTNGGGTGHLLGLSFDTEAWDSDGFHDPAVNPSRLTVPAGLAGKYVALGSSAWSALVSAAGIRQTGWRKNGADAAGQLNILAGTAGGGNELDTQSLGFFNLAVGDYLEYGVYQNSGSTINILSGASFGMVRIGS